MSTVFTIGHSNLELPKFIALLQQHGIQAVADVRSAPYSQYAPQFNREPLQRALQEHTVAYVFLGAELGARRSERECYVHGKADYSLIARSSAFVRGLDRVVQGAAKVRIALMCAEKDPVECHRCILIAPALRHKGLEVVHILNNGLIETYQETEKRLFRLFELAERDLFLSAEEIVAEAYKLQAEKIAYQEQDVALREEPPYYGD